VISEGPYIISNVATPIGQAQPSPEQTGDKTYDINVLVSQFFSKLQVVLTVDLSQFSASSDVNPISMATSGKIKQTTFIV